MVAGGEISFVVSAVRSDNDPGDPTLNNLAWSDPHLIKMEAMDVWMHSCGHIIDILPTFAEVGLDVIQMLQQVNMGLENLNEKVGGNIATEATDEPAPYTTDAIHRLWAEFHFEWANLHFALILNPVTNRPA